MTVDIFNFFQNVTDVKIFVGVAGFIVILLFILIKISEKYNNKNRKDKENFQRNVDEIIELSKNWSTQVKILNGNTFFKEYKRLLKYRDNPRDEEYATSSVITIYVNEEKKIFDLDTDGLYTLYTYLKNDVEGRDL